MPFFKELFSATFKKIAIVASLFVLSTAGLFVFYIFPRINTIVINEREKVTHEMTSFLTAIFDEMEQKIASDILTTEQAQKMAKAFVQDFRYGKDNNDYFWINRTNDGVMLAHPNADLIETDIANLVDQNGFELGTAMLNAIKNDTDAHVQYLWPSKTDPDIHVKKMSYVIEYEPWGWMIGTGIYIDDVQKEVFAITNRVILVFTLLFFFMIGLLIYILIVGSKIERQRNTIQMEFMSLIRHLPIGIFRSKIDKDGNDIPPVLWNQALVDLLELPSYKYLTNEKFRLEKFFKKPKDREDFIKMILKEKTIISKEYEITTFTGKKIWVRLYGRLVKKDGKMFFDASLEDITQKQKAKEVLEKSYRELQRIDQMKNEIISITSHELRTPLTIIKGFASFLLKKEVGDLNEEQKKHVSKIVKNTDKLLEMITNMLDLEKLEDGKMYFEKKEVDLRDLLKNVYEDFHIRCTKEKKKITIDLPQKPIMIKTDPEQMKRVFINLIDNALKFSKPQEGKVSIFAKEISDDKIEIHIKDNGIGIDKNDMKNVFEKFKQVGDHTQRVYDGSGLGLPIVKKIVEGLGGTVNCESVLGSGSDFYVTLRINN
jgi:signal transduction histidine kinase